MTPACTRRPLVVAHRGDSRNFPENTLSSVRGAMALGVDVVELDVHRSADDVAIILHDRDLKRTTGRADRVDALTAAELCALDVGSWFGSAHGTARIPSLAQVMNEIGETDIGLCLEFKDGDYRAPDDAARWLVDQFARFSLHRRAVANLANANIAMRVRRLDANIRIALDCNVCAAGAEATALAVKLAASGANLVELEHRVVTAGMVQTCKEAGLPVWAWTANEPADWDRLCAAGVDAILTDDPAGLIAYLADGEKTGRLL